MATTCTPKEASSATASGPSLTTPSFTLATGDSVVAVVCDPDQTISTVKWNGVDLTQLVSARDPGDAKCEIWALHNVTGATATLVVTWSAATTDRYVNTFQLSGGTFNNDTDGGVGGNTLNANVTTDASVTHGDCVAIGGMSTLGSITSVAGDTDTINESDSGTDLSWAGAYEVHAAASGTLTSNWTNSRAKLGACIAVFYPAAATQYVGAGVVSSAGAAPAAAVSPGSVNVPATVSSSSGTAPAAAVAPGSVNVPATVSSSSGTPPDAAVAPGLVNVPAVVVSAAGTAPDAAVDATSYVPAEVAAATGAAPDAAVAPGSVDVPAEVVSAAGATVNALVAPGLVNVQAEVAAATAAAVAAGVAPGLVNVQAEVAAATAAAVAAGVAPGSVNVVAEVAAATASAVGQGVTFSHPPVKYHAPYSSPSAVNLPKGLTLNSITEYPVFRYLGPSLLPDGYGNELSEAGSGSAIEYDLLGPYLGAQDGAVKFNAGKYLKYTGSSYADLTTEDPVWEFVWCQDALGGRIFSKRQTSPSHAGYSIIPTTDSVVTIYLFVGGSSLTLSITGLVPGAFYHLFAAINRNENASNGAVAYLNGVEADTGNFSTLSASATNTGNLCLGGSENYATYMDGQVAYAAMYMRDNWIQTGAKTEIQQAAQERHWKACGIWPALAQGTAAPTSFTSSPRSIERFDASDEKALVHVGAGWPRVEEWEDSTGKFRGHNEEPAVTELQPYTEDLSGYTTNNGSVLNSPTTTAPDDTTTAYNVFHESDSPPSSNVLVYYDLGPSHSGGSRYLISVLAKYINRAWFRMYLSNTGTPGVYCNCQTGATGAASGVDASGVIDFKNGWFRFWALITESGGLQRIFIIRAADDDTGGLLPTMDGLDQDSFYLWGFNHAQEDALRNYRRNETGSTLAFDEDDLLFKTDDGNIGGVGSDKQLRMSADILLRNHDIVGAARTIFTLSDGGLAADHIRAEVSPTNDAYGSVANNASTPQWNHSDTADLADGERHHVEQRWKPNNSEGWVDGSLAAGPDTSCDPPDNLDTGHVGSKFDGTAQIGGLIANLIAWQELEVTAEVASATGTANPCTVQLTLNVPAEVAASTATELDAAVSPGSVNVAAGVVSSTGAAVAAGVAPGSVSVPAGVVSSAGTAPDAAVAPGAVQVAAGVVSSAATALAAAVVPGSVQVAAQVAAATASAVAATVAPGLVNVVAGVVSAVATAVNATVSLGGGAQYVAAEVVSAAATALAAVVAPGSVSVPAEVASATGTAPDATVAPGGVNVAAAVVSSAGAAPDAAVAPGSVSVPATVSSSSAATVDAAVSPGSVNVPAAVAASTGTANAAAVSPGSVNVAAEVASSTATASNATAFSATTQYIAAGVVSAVGTALDLVAIIRAVVAAWIVLRQPETEAAVSLLTVETEADVALGRVATETTVELEKPE